MARRRWFRPFFLVLGGGVAALTITWSLPQLLDGVGRAFSGEATWQAIERARPLIQRRADEALRQLGIDPSQLTGIATTQTPDPEVGFGGDEVWFVRYWTTPPTEYIQQFTDPGEWRVYLNDQGTVRRIERGFGGTRAILFGKNRYIETGMSYEEVLERLGEPDLRQPTPQRLRNRGDEVWIYKADVSRRATIKVYFRSQRVTTTSGEAPVIGSLLGRTFLNGIKKRNLPERKTLQWSVHWQKEQGKGKGK